MQSKATDIARDMYRISTLHPDFGIQFNQSIIRDDEPFLMHTGYRGMLPDTLEGVKSVINPASLRWIGFSQLEADGSGALNEWLRIAPHAQAICSYVGVTASVSAFADSATRALAD